MSAGGQFKAAAVLRREIVNGAYRINLQSAVYVREKTRPAVQVLIADFRFHSSSLMQNSQTIVFSVIPAQAGIQKMLIRRVLSSWTPACAGATIPFASRC